MDTIDFSLPTISASLLLYLVSWGLLDYAGYRGWKPTNFTVFLGYIGYVGSFYLLRNYQFLHMLGIILCYVVVYAIVKAIVLCAIREPER